MLVIARRKGETLLIGENIEINVLEIQGDKVKIGVSAPKNIRVLRKELLEELRSANEAAAVDKANLKALADKLKK